MSPAIRMAPVGSPPASGAPPSNDRGLLRPQTLAGTPEHTIPRMHRSPWGIEATDTATCLECVDGRASPVGEDWACISCGHVWPIEATPIAQRETL